MKNWIADHYFRLIAIVPRQVVAFTIIAWIFIFLILAIAIPVVAKVFVVIVFTGIGVIPFFTLMRVVLKMLPEDPCKEKE